MSKQNTQSGFSAIELLISLFIAVAFVSAGYQLYAVILKDGSEAKLRATANDIAYERLRAYSAQATNPCTTITPTATLPTPSGLPPGTTIAASITCPYGSNPVSKIAVTILYGTPQKEVTHATYVKN
ncbi:MAG: hypothetical protein JWM07_743 [Candidatus Saccharibacteria bacterium]|nr:hypothetical protein [Candidatus Saccharibacteria bacterium]